MVCDYLAISPHLYRYEYLKEMKNCYDYHSQKNIQISKHLKFLLQK